MFEIKIIETGCILADGGAMFGAVPKRAWSRVYDSDANNLCRLAMRCVLAVSDSRRILVDAGMGNIHLNETKYYQPSELRNIVDCINEFGFSTEDITDVVLTHLHFDHSGGAFCMTNGEIVPVFPNATYWISRDQWENLSSLHPLEKDSVFVSDFVCLQNSAQLRLVAADCQICDGFDIRIVNGHTIGQLLLLFKTEGGVVAFPADLVPTASHISLGWISAYDLCASTSYSEKEYFLSEAAEKEYSLIYCHDDKVVMSKVKQFNKNYKSKDFVYKN